MLQLQLLEVSRTEEELVLVEATSKSRTDPTDGAHSGDGLSNRTQESE